MKVWDERGIINVSDSCNRKIGNKFNVELKVYIIFLIDKQEMVKLNFVLYTHAPLSKVWSYFSCFQNTAQWDPNVKSAKISKSTENGVGSIYDLVTIFNGNESDIQYHMTGYEEYKKIELYGKNTMVQAVDQILFREKNTGTEIQYRADIRLRHIFGLFTPFIRKDLDNLVVQAKSGMTKKCEELFGKQ